ncbi:dimethylaniline monooxygenase [Coprinopsis sp. MPI-PUGE-AT-0042]|nr:dimethylaniline monooxygenase [Coprinopsis sp. MPI-PUGE-AT-0042]
MPSVLHLLRVLLTFGFFTYPEPLPQPKVIAIVGAGSAGLAALKSFLDLPLETRRNWDVILYEQREDVAGVWLPDPHPPKPPGIPYSPLYPLLHTNTPVPFMTYPGQPFPPGTPLYPSHEHVQAYHRRYASRHNLLSSIKLRHTVSAASWSGTSKEGIWNVTVSDSHNQTLCHKADHLIVASGNHHIPRIPHWPGQAEWLEYGQQVGLGRDIMHSVYHRSPEDYRNRTLLVIGSGSSGCDIAAHSTRFTNKTYLSARHDVSLPPGSDDVVLKPDVSHFTRNSVVFIDGTELREVDSVLLATGYEQRKPFLEIGNALVVDPSARSNSSSSQRGGILVTNLRYIFPLHEHILSLSSAHPPNALAFIGLPTSIANCPSDIAQSLFAIHSILNPKILPGRKELLGKLAAREESLKQSGFEPYAIGHKMVVDSSDYQDQLVEYLKKVNAIPDDGRPFVEQWRRDIFNYTYLKRGWKRIEALGESERWLEGVETEDQWVTLMQRVNAWQRDYEVGDPFRFTVSEQV